MLKSEHALPFGEMRGLLSSSEPRIVSTALQN